MNLKQTIHSRVFLAFWVIMTCFTVNLKAQRTCATHEKHVQKMKTDPEYARQYNEVQRKIEERTKWYLKDPARMMRRAPRTIPVVVHLVDGNLTDEDVQNEIDVLNEDFRALNSDISGVPGAFEPLIGDAMLEFCLAKVDPQGNPSTGILRGGTCEEGAWDRRKYLNLWVCDISDGILGYATFPSNAYNSIVVMGTNYFAPGGSGAFNLGRTTTHEIGHYFNLNHIWGDANCGNDQVDDTPTQQTSNGGCPSFPNVTCGNGPNGDMFMNYMDYVDDRCMFMFSIGQAARMNAAIDTYYEGYFDHEACNNEVPPLAAISADKTSGCGSLTVQFTDNSSGNPNKWTWDFGDGNTSSEENPQHTYNTPGTYSVTLEVENDFGDNTITETDLILVEEGVPFSDQSVGPLDNTFGDGGNFEGEQFLVFDVESACVISSVKVYAQGSGDRTVVVLDANDNTIHTKTIAIPDGESIISLDFEMEPGIEYRIGVNGTPNLYRNNSDPSYPYELSGVLSITQSTASSDPFAFYYYFYDWKVRKAGCDTEPNVTTEISDQEVRIYPNPVNDELKFEGLKGGAHITIYNSYGAIMLNGSIGDEAIDVKNYPKGIYHININNNYTSRFVKH